MTVDYAKQLEAIDTDMSPTERQLAIINGIQNNLGILIDMVYKIEARVAELEAQKFVDGLEVSDE